LYIDKHKDDLTFSHYLADFSSFIQGSSNILLTELYAIYKDLLLAKDMNIDGLVCYCDCLHCVNLIKGLQVRYHIHVVLIQDIKELLSQTNVSLYHTLREVWINVPISSLNLELSQMSASWLVFLLQKAFVIFLRMM
jgi:hypothetical protein